MKTIEKTQGRPSGRRVHFYEDVSGKVRWTQYGQNGVIVDASSQGFSSRDAAVENWKKRIDDGLKILADGDVFFKHDAENFDKVDIVS